MVADTITRWITYDSIAEEQTVVQREFARDTWTRWAETYDAWDNSSDEPSRGLMTGLAVLVNREAGEIDCLMRTERGVVLWLHESAHQGGLTMRIAEEHPIAYLAAIYEECDPPSFQDASDHYRDGTARLYAVHLRSASDEAVGSLALTAHDDADAARRTMDLLLGLTAQIDCLAAMGDHHGAHKVGTVTFDRRYNAEEPGHYYDFHRA